MGHLLQGHQDYLVFYAYDVHQEDIFNIGKIFFLVCGGNGLVGKVMGMIIVRRGIAKPR